MAQLEFQEVSFRYPEGERAVLQEVSFQLERGEFVLLCGASGCGKTTLLRHILKSQIPVGIGEGDMLFEGQSIERMPDEEAVSKISYVGQDAETAIVTDTVWQELAFGLESLGIPVAEIRRRTAEMAEYFGLGKLFRTRTASLSGGQKQLLNLASAMIVQPELLVLDEPTSQLDPVGAERFLNTLWKLHQEFGVTVLLSEQRLEQVLPLADRVFVMTEGKVETVAPRQCGALLRKQQSAVYPALPVASRVAIEWGECSETLPLTIREGQLWLHHQLQAAGVANTPAAVTATEGNVRMRGSVKEEFCLQAKHVSFSYHSGEPVLRDLHWKLPTGSIYGILGGNGSGKSTALKLLAGILKPQSGKIQSSSSIVYLPQNPKAVFSDITVAEELAQFLVRRSSESEAEIIRKAEAILEFMELTQNRDTHPYDLSGGQAQRLAIAKALLAEPDILLLDEPAKGLDAQFKKKLGECFRKLVQQGMTIVLVSHDVEFCAEYTSHCALLFDGEIICQGVKGDFFRDNYFYLPAASKMAAKVWKDVLLGEEIVERLEECSPQDKRSLCEAK